MVLKGRSLKTSRGLRHTVTRIQIWNRICWGEALACEFLKIVRPLLGLEDTGEGTVF